MIVPTLIVPTLIVPTLIVPTLCVGMQPRTLRVQNPTLILNLRTYHLILFSFQKTCIPVG